MHRRPRLAAALFASLFALALPAAAIANTQEEDLILKTGDTPFLRLEQTNGSGFTPQTWDVAGNEANFFVRDVTGGSRLPFRIRPGAPTSSIDIAASGDVGIGTASPQAPLEISRNGAVSLLYTDSTASTGVSWATGMPFGGSSFMIGLAGTEPVFELQPYGELDLGGTLGEAANQNTVSGLQNVDPETILTKVEGLPIQSWRYAGGPAGARHLGPLAASFGSAFGLGENPSLISPADVAGVSLVAVKALAARNQALASKLAAAEGSARGLFTENGALAARVAKLEPLRVKVGKLAKQMKSLRKAVRQMQK